MTSLLPFLSQAAQAQNALKEPETKIVIPEGTLILTHLADPLNSHDVRTGDVFKFVVAENVVVNGFTVIPLNAKGVGHVTEAHSAGSHGKSGGMRIAFDYIFAADGSQIPVVHNSAAEEKDRSTLGATALGIILTGGLGLFFHNFVHGSDITIPVDAKTYVTTLAPKPVLVTDSDRQPIAIPSPASLAPAPIVSPPPNH